jgi:hypothetical protein
MRVSSICATGHKQMCRPHNAMTTARKRTELGGGFLATGACRAAGIARGTAGAACRVPGWPVGSRDEAPRGKAERKKGRVRTENERTRNGKRTHSKRKPTALETQNERTGNAKRLCSFAAHVLGRRNEGTAREGAKGDAGEGGVRSHECRRASAADGEGLYEAARRLMRLCGKAFVMPREGFRDSAGRPS